MDMLFVRQAFDVNLRCSLSVTDTHFTKCVRDIGLFDNCFTDYNLGKQFCIILCRIKVNNTWFYWA